MNARFGIDASLPAGALRLTVGDTRLGNGLSTGDPVALRLPDGNTVVSAYEAHEAAGREPDRRGAAGSRARAG